MSGSKLVKRVSKNQYKPGAIFRILCGDMIEPELLLQYKLDTEGYKVLYCIDKGVGREYVCDSGFLLNNKFIYMEEAGW